MKKRYPVNHEYHDVYNDFYVRYQHQSEIFNIGDQTPSMTMIIYDKHNIEIEILRRQGNEDGKYYKVNEEQMQIAKIPLIKSELEQIEKSFKSHQQDKVNAGFEKPTEYPKELLTLKLQLEAKMDVIIGEVEVLQKKLDELEEVIQKVNDSHVLERGMRCSGHFWGTSARLYEQMNVLKDIDGQPVTQLADGTLIIDCPSSKYDGLDLISYRKLAKQWVSDKIFSDREKLNKMQTLAKEYGQPVPDVLPVDGGRRVSQDSLPAFPDWATNHKAKKEKDDSGEVRKRSK